MTKIDSKLLYESIGGVEETLLAESEGMAKGTAHRARLLRPIAAAAACVCLLAGALAALPYLKKATAPTDGDFQDEVQQGPADELVKEPTWAQSDAVRHFPEVNFAGKVYTGHSAPLPQEKIGEKLGDVTLRGYDIYKDQTHTADASLYRIAGIAQECAVAVKQDGEQVLYPYINSGYAPATLGQMLGDLSLRENLSFGPVYSADDSMVYRPRKSGNATSAEAAGAPADALWTLLLASRDAAAVEEPSGRPVCKVSVNLPLLGYANMSLSILDDGHIMTNLLDSGKTFRVGKDKVGEFLAYLEEHCEKVPVKADVHGEPIPE